MTVGDESGMLKFRVTGRPGARVYVANEDKYPDTKCDAIVLDGCVHDQVPTVVEVKDKDGKIVSLNRVCQVGIRYTEKPPVLKITGGISKSLRCIPSVASVYPMQRK